MASTRDARIEIRLPVHEKRAWRARAKGLDQNLSEWIRRMCNTGAVPVPAPVAPVVTGDQIDLPFVKKTKKKAS